MLPFFPRISQLCSFADWIGKSGLIQRKAATTVIASEEMSVCQSPASIPGGCLIFTPGFTWHMYIPSPWFFTGFQQRKNKSHPKVISNCWVFNQWCQCLTNVACHLEKAHPHFAQLLITHSPPRSNLETSTASWAPTTRPTKIMNSWNLKSWVLDPRCLDKWAGDYSFSPSYHGNLRYIPPRNKGSMAGLIKGNLWLIAP